MSSIEQVARVLMQRRGFEDIRFESSGQVTAKIDEQRIIIACIDDLGFEADWGRYTLWSERGGYEPAAFHELATVQREAARLSAETGEEYKVIDELAE